MNKELLKAAWVRAYRSFLQALIAQIPSGFIITPAMIQYFKVSYVFVILAIVANAVLYGFASFVTCVVGGLPEVEYAEHIYMSEEEPEDSYSEEEYDPSEEVMIHGED